MQRSSPAVRSLLRPVRQDRLADTRIVWLPGAFHTPEDFVHAGFDSAVARRGLEIDLQFADLALDHIGMTFPPNFIGRCGAEAHIMG